jgi:hypothetical protein
MLLATSVMVAGNAYADPIHVATVQALWVQGIEQLNVVDLRKTPAPFWRGDLCTSPNTGEWFAQL